MIGPFSEHFCFFFEFFGTRTNFNEYVNYSERETAFLFFDRFGSKNGFTKMGNFDFKSLVFCFKL